MFTVKEKSAAQADRSLPTAATLISAGTSLNGDVHSETDLRIDGAVIGNIYCSSKIIIGPSGSIEGNISGTQADISGRVRGNIVVKELLQLKGQCHVAGNIPADQLQIAPTATFNGQCQMGPAEAAQVVQMKENEKPLAKAK